MTDMQSTVYGRSMSKTIQIRDVPEAVHATLRGRAAREGLSLSDFMLREATRIAERPPMAEVLRAMADRDWGVAPGEAVATLRELRDAAS